MLGPCSTIELYPSLKFSLLEAYLWCFEASLCCWNISIVVFWGRSMLFCIMAMMTCPPISSIQLFSIDHIIAGIWDQIQSLGLAGKALSYKDTAPVLCVCVCLLVINWFNLLIDYNHSEVRYLTIWVAFSWSFPCTYWSLAHHQLRSLLLRSIAHFLIQPPVLLVPCVL